MDIDQAIAVLEEACKNPHSGLPENVFLFLTRLTPMVNVDLLIKDDDGRTLLTWRDDVHHGSGWHVPGGIIRHKETAAERISATALRELGCRVLADDYPIEVNECIKKPQLNRGHCISLLYRCKLASHPSNTLKCRGESPKAGMFRYFDCSPGNLLPVHEIYRKFID